MNTTPTYTFHIFYKGCEALTDVLQVVFFTPWDEVDMECNVMACDRYVKESFEFWLDHCHASRGYCVDSSRLSPSILWCALHNPSNDSPYDVRVDGDIPSGPDHDDEYEEYDEGGVFESANKKEKKKKEKPVLSQEAQELVNNQEKNIQRGKAALRIILRGAEEIEKALYREGFGWIKFKRGTPGIEPEKNIEKLKKIWFSMTPKQRKAYAYNTGYGMLHIFKKREWESKYIQEFLGQDIVKLLDEIIITIVKGKPGNKKDDNISFSRPGFSAFLTRDKGLPDGEDCWLLSGYAKETQGYKLVNPETHELITESVDETVDTEPICTTNSEPTLGRRTEWVPYGEMQSAPKISPELRTNGLHGDRPKVGATDSDDVCVSESSSDVKEIFEAVGNNENNGGNMINYEQELRGCKAFADVKALFEKWFGVKLGADPEDYKNQTSDYGLKARGVRTREVLNEQCKAILARVSDPKDLTKEDRAILVQYSGKGGLTENSQYEYYTPTHVAQGVWDAMLANGFENGNVLEPSCGAGVFLGTKPQGVVMTANDLDPIGSGVARLLNPDDSVTTSPFEQVVMDTPDDTFDSCVGNVPFGDARGASMHIDKAYKKEKVIERYFILRILDKVKPGGLVCLVCPTNIVCNKGKAWKEFRYNVSKKAEFLGAHKLPSGTFGGKGGQGTDVVTDVVVFRKHGRDLLDKLSKDKIQANVLTEANVLWSEFLDGKYWQGEGKRFIHGKYIPKGNGRFKHEKVEGNIDNAALRQKLAQKFHSRINYELLETAETITRNYADGDTRYINGEPYQYMHGEWSKMNVVETPTKIDMSVFGVKSAEELQGLLSNNKTALGLTLEQAQAALDAYPHYMTPQQKAAISFALSQKEEIREQVYRGSIIGSMITKMGVDEEGGEDVSAHRQWLQEVILKEIEKYGHPAHNSKLKIAGGEAQAFGVFMNAVDKKGNFSALLAGTLDREQAKGYQEDSISDIVTHLCIHENYPHVELDDIKKLYKGNIPLNDVADLTGIEGVSITPDGMVVPSNRYLCGNVIDKIGQLTVAVANTDDERLKTQYRKQIEAMDAKIKRVPIEDITFSLHSKWFDKKYILEFLRENGFRNATFGTVSEVLDYGGRVTKEFVENLDAYNGEYRLKYVDREANKDRKYEAQLEKYINGQNIKSKYSAEYKERISIFEAQFDNWMKQHLDANELAEMYNKKFNGYVAPEYETSKLDIDDIISGDIKPHTYQNQEVRRLSEQGSGICGFGVGLGKSFTALALAGHNFKHGKSKRTCVVVPSAVLENWYHEANMFYNRQYMRNKVFFVGLEPKTDKDGNILQKPLLDENGNPRTREDGSAVMQDVVRMRNDKASVYEAMWKIPQSNYSLVVMTKEKFQSIPIKQDTMEAYTRDMVDRHLMSEKAAKTASEDRTKKVSYNEDKRMSRLEGKFSDEGTDKKGELPYLEDMGFDSIITDESHFFKNSLEGGERTKNVVYVPNPTTSKIAVDMAIKCNYMRTKNGGRGVYGLTATPVTNSPIEIFNMLSLVAPKEEFENMGVRTVDDFVRLFGKIELHTRSTVTGELKEKDTLVGFKNLSGLRSLFRKYVNIKTVEDVDSEIHVPNAEEIEEEVPMTPEQEELYAMLRNRANGKDEYGNMTSEEPPSIFTTIRDMDRVTTDTDMYYHQMTFTLDGKYADTIKSMIAKLSTTYEYKEEYELTGKEQIVKGTFEPKYDFNGKTCSLVVHEANEAELLKTIKAAGIPLEEINHPIAPKYAKLIENMKRHLDIGGKQIVFTEEMSQHGKIKRILVHNLPITMDNVAIINADEASGNEMDKISKAYNAGEVKIVVANKKAEVGVNLQKGTTAIHHLTLPWTPASIDQRNGRGVRQGNKVDTVQIYYYAGKGTFDSYRKQLLKGKGNWINQLLTGNESSAINANMAAEEEFSAELTGNGDKYRAALAAAEEQKRNKAKSQSVNMLKALQDATAKIDNFENFKADERRNIQSDIDSRKIRLERAKRNAEEETDETSRAKLNASIERLEKIIRDDENRLESFDANMDALRKKMESNKYALYTRLQKYANSGVLPFDKSLIDNPGSVLIDRLGRIIEAGSFWETTAVIKDSFRDIPKGTICEIEDINLSSRIVCLHPLKSDLYRVRQVIDRLPLKPSSLSASEINLKRFIDGELTYARLATSGISREDFEEHKATATLAYGSSALGYRNGEHVFVDGINIKASDENIQIVYPDINDKAFRREWLEAYVLYVRNNNRSTQVAKLMEELFGKSYEDEAAEFKKLMPEEDIAMMARDAYNEVFGHFWDKDKEQNSENWTIFKTALANNASTIGFNVHDKLRAAGYDNSQHATRDIVATLFKAKLTEITKIIDEEAEKERVKAEEERLAKEAAERAEKEARDKADAERLKAEYEKASKHPDFKEVPGEVVQKFRDLGMRIQYPTEDLVLPYKSSRTEVKAFSRVFVQDPVGKGGKLYKAVFRNKLKDEYDASGTSSWSGHEGFWWHFDAEAVDFEKLYKMVANA